MPSQSLDTGPWRGEVGPLGWFYAFREGMSIAVSDGAVGSVNGGGEEGDAAGHVDEGIVLWVLGTAVKTASHGGRVGEKRGWVRVRKVRIMGPGIVNARKLTGVIAACHERGPVRF